ncbi:MAG: hypothetical protein WC783_00110 [Candidatus Paceibacterota bacterium]|jgi:hypothetical protein
MNLITSVRKKINRDLSSVNGIFDYIPLSSISEVLKKYNIHVVQEDGTPWSGFISAPIDTQVNMRFDLAMLTGEPLDNTSLQLYVYKFATTKRYEIVTYVS